ncbi:unnamed protein product [Sphagnum compactum]
MGNQCYQCYNVVRTLPPFSVMTHGGSIPPTNGTDSGPHSIVGVSLGMGTSIDITPGGMEWTEPAKRNRGRPRKYVIPEIAQLAILALGTLPAASPRTPLNIIGMSRYYVSHVDIGMQDVARKIMSFAQVGRRAMCIILVNGAISNVTLRQQSTSGAQLLIKLAPGNFSHKGISKIMVA